MKSLVIVRQAAPSLVVALAAEILVGGLFGRLSGSLEALPGLLVLVPAILAVCGNVNMALASRLSSALHIGSLAPDASALPALRREVLATAAIGGGMGLVAGMGAHLLVTALGLPSVGWLPLAALAAAVVSISALLVAAFTARAVMGAFRRGIDPDNVSGSFVLTLSDLLTMTLLLLVTGGWLAWR